MSGNRLVLDVGMSDGTDAAAYLKQGYDVVAVEANPVAVTDAYERFEDELDTGQLRILHCAVAHHAGTVQLSLDDNAPAVATISHAHIARSGIRAAGKYRLVEVPARMFENILDDVGVPYYLKIDIEGSDMLCINALSYFDERPTFVSMESRLGFKGWPAVMDELFALWHLGYRRFAYVNQQYNPPLSSGPFGEALNVRWLTLSQALSRAAALHATQRVREHRGQPLPSWWDLHARM